MVVLRSRSLSALAAACISRRPLAAARMACSALAADAIRSSALSVESSSTSSGTFKSTSALAAAFISSDARTAVLSSTSSSNSASALRSKPLNAVAATFRATSCSSSFRALSALMAASRCVLLGPATDSPLPLMVSSPGSSRKPMLFSSCQLCLSERVLCLSERNECSALVVALCSLQRRTST